MAGRSATGSVQYAIRPNTMMPSMISVVVIGRLMNSDYRLMASPSGRRRLMLTRLWLYG